MNKYPFNLFEIDNKLDFKFTEREITNGFEILWVTVDEAISLIENDKPDDYEGSIIVQRDLVLLKEANSILKR